MAVLSTADRQRIWRGLQRYWSNARASYDISKALLLTLVNETDAWIDDNAASYNSALSANTLSATQKTLLFCCVAAMRVSPTVAALLQRLLGVEVD
jgi:hypothetical protein